MCLVIAIVLSVCVWVRARLAFSLSPSLSLMCVCLCVFARGSVCLRSSCLGRREEEHQEQRTQSQLFFFLFFFFSSAKEAASVGPAGQEAGTGSGWMGPALIGPVTGVKVEKSAHSHFLVVAVFFVVVETTFQGDVVSLLVRGERRKTEDGGEGENSEETLRAV